MDPVSCAEKVARLHASKFGNVEGKRFLICDLSVTLGAAACHVQRVANPPARFAFCRKQADLLGLQS